MIWKLLLSFNIHIISMKFIHLILNAAQLSQLLHSLCVP